jgi:hypothetical protein
VLFPEAFDGISGNFNMHTYHRLYVNGVHPELGY